MLPGLAEFVVQGVTMEGQMFQPEDWADQLCAKLAQAGADGHVAYSAFVRPEMVQGARSLIVRSSLKEVDPKAFDLIKQYVADHHLVVRAGRGVINAESSGSYRFIKEERRDPKRNSW